MYTPLHHRANAFPSRQVPNLLPLYSKTTTLPPPPRSQILHLLKHYSLKQHPNENILIPDVSSPNASITHTTQSRVMKSTVNNTTPSITPHNIPSYSNTPLPPGLTYDKTFPRSCFSLVPLQKQFHKTPLTISSYNTPPSPSPTSPAYFISCTAPHN